MHDYQRAALRPVVAAFEEAMKLWRSAANPLSATPFAPGAAALCELGYRIGRDYPKPSFSIAHIDTDRGRIDIEEAVVSRRTFCRLVNFSKPGWNGPVQEKVLLVAPLSGHHVTLLRDTVRALLAEHDVYITDWVDARSVPASHGEFHLKDYVRNVRDFIREIGDGAHVVAICQPAVPVLAAVSLLATEGGTQPASLSLLAGPIDAGRSPTEVNRLAYERPYEWFERNLIHPVPEGYPGAGRLVYPGFLQLAAFMTMNPDRHLKAHADFVWALMRGDTEAAERHRVFYDEYFSVLDMPAGFYLDTIKVVFQDRALARGAWVPDGVPVQPEDITRTALLTVEGELDDICGAGQTHAAQELCASLPSSMRQSLTVGGAGHYGVFSGARWRNVVCPAISAFIAAHRRR